jgi:hypothetical protein
MRIATVGGKWRRRADSNRRMEVLQTSPLTTWVRRPNRAFANPESTTPFEGQAIKPDREALRMPKAYRSGGLAIAHQALEPGQHLVRAERLGNVVVGAEFEAAHDLALALRRSQHHDRNVPSGRIRS